MHSHTRPLVELGSRSELNLIGLITPVVLSTLALVIVIAHGVAGNPPLDEQGLSARVFELLIAAETPFSLLFILTCDWTRPSYALRGLALQALAFLSAVGLVGLAGF